MKVAVIGAGAAGLYSAWLLERQGVEVVVFEARDRTGGRLFSPVQPNEVLFEAGGEWIDADHHFTVDLIRALGLELIQAPTTDRWYVFDGIGRPESNLWEGVSNAESALDSAISTALVRNDQTWVGRTVQDFLSEVSMSQEGRWITTARIRSDEGEEPSRLDCQAWLGAQALYANRTGGEMSAFRVKDGAAQICDNLANSIRGEIRLLCPAISLSVETDSVMVETALGPSQFDTVVVAIPPLCLSQIKFSQGAMESSISESGLSMTRTVKFSLIYSAPWWKDLGMGGSFMSNRAYQQAWPSTQSNKAVLSIYVCGDDAEWFRSRRDPVADCQAAIATDFPSSTSAFEGGAFFDWIGDPWSQGGFSFVPASKKPIDYEQFQRQRGPIYFAGEQTSRWAGFIEGALESAVSAVDCLVKNHA